MATTHYTVNTYPLNLKSASSKFPFSLQYIFIGFVNMFNVRVFRIGFQFIAFVFEIKKNLESDSAKKIQ